MNYVNKLLKKEPETTVEIEEVEKIEGQESPLDAKEVAEKLISDARAVAEDIRLTAMAQAEQMIADAKREAEQLLEKSKQEREARNRTVHRELFEGYHDSKRLMREEILNVQKTLMETNCKIIELEKKTAVGNTELIYRCFEELYDIIEDTRQSHTEKASRSGNEDYINMIYNLEEFSEIIMDAFSAVGIGVIVPKQGDKFQSELYEAYDSRGQRLHSFDPHHSTVGERLRNGFTIGEVVQRKAKVTLK